MSGPLTSDSNSNSDSDSDSDAGADSDGSDDTIAAVVDTIARTAPEIRDGLVGRRETVDDEENPSGETQVEADVWADELLEDRLSEIDGLVQYASEERDDVLECDGSSESESERSEAETETNDDESGLSVAVDPLDGSSNLASNNPIGTIFGLYDAPLPARGRDLVAAGYVCYGPITTMVVATDDGVTVSELTGDDTDTDDGSRRLLETDTRVPEDPTVYGFGGRVPDWPGDFQAYAREIESELKLRYGGAMVADVNQVLTYGGIFSYPGLESRPEGKLRLQFEGNPIAYIVERAGGRSSNGDRSLLDVEPTEVHQRTPVHVGSGELIERLEAALE